MITYVVQMDGPDRLVKFGRTTNVKSRVSTLKTGLPWPLHVVALFGTDVERELKSRFAADKVQGEWFRPTQALFDYLTAAADDGRLVRQMPVDHAYINAAIKPRLREYLGGREPANNACGDLVRCILADLLPTIAGREREISVATKHQIADSLLRGYGPCTDRPQLAVPEVDTEARAA